MSQPLPIITVPALPDGAACECGDPAARFFSVQYLRNEEHDHTEVTDPMLLCEPCAVLSQDDAGYGVIVFAF